MMEQVMASLLAFAFGAPIYMPWVLARFGKYRGWYLAHFVPPFVWSRSVYFFPLSAVFVCAPFLALIPVDVDTRGSLWGIASMLGIIVTPIIVIWTPRWLKPNWQRYLEDNYSQDEIRAFISVWREMGKKEWSTYLDSEEDIDELVKITRQKLRQSH